MAEVVVVGSYIQDLSFKTDCFPQPGESRFGSFVTCAGGKGFNQAVAARRAGVSSAFIGSVGNDAFGQGLRQFAESEDIELCLELSERPTGTAAVLVNAKGENMIVLDPGANQTLTSNFVSLNEATFRDAKVLLTQMEVSSAVNERAYELAKQHGCRRILNPAPMSRELNRELIRQTDILVPNEIEFAQLSQNCLGHSLAVKDMSDEEIATVAGKLGIPILLLTLGENGVFVYEQSESAKPYRVPAIKVDAIDTTGAGDAFCGGLAVGLVRHPKDLKKAVQFANVVAGLSTTKRGTAQSMPTAEEISCYPHG